MNDSGKKKPPQSAKELLERYEQGERDFRDANLSLANLSGAKLIGADLSDANLSGANLISANLRDANLFNANLRDANLRDANLFNANLFNANLFNANLRDANLRDANLRDANLSYANLFNANLRDANLFNANLMGANLFNAYLMGANLRDANLRDANLIDANLIDANLIDANLIDAVLLGANLGYAMLTNIDLTPLCEESTIQLDGAAVEWRSVAKSLRAPNLEQFLVRTGMPLLAAQYLIDSLKAIDPQELFMMLQSVFISYGGPDEAFASKLNEALKKSGVKTWFFPDNAVPGERLHRMMWKGIKNHDRTVLICSENSLQRRGVLNEIKQALTRETGIHEIIIPIRLDDFLFSWKPEEEALQEVVDELCARVVSDFRDTMNDETKFNKELGKLLKALGPRSK